MAYHVDESARPVLTSGVFTAVVDELQNLKKRIVQPTCLNQSCSALLFVVFALPVKGGIGIVSRETEA